MVITKELINGFKIASIVFITIMIVYTFFVLFLVCTYAVQLNSTEAPSPLVIKSNTLFLSDMEYIAGGFIGCIMITAISASITFGLQNKRKKDAMRVENADDMET